AATAVGTDPDASSGDPGDPGDTGDPGGAGDPGDPGGAGDPGDAGDEVAAVLVAAVVAARDALERTPSQLEPLRRAGVVDAGGYGLVLLLEQLAAVHGADLPPWTGTSARPRESGEPGEPGRPGDRATCPAEPDGELELMAVLRVRGRAAPAPAPTAVERPEADGPAARLRRHLAAVGGSVAVVEGPGLLHAHVHTDDLARALDALDDPGLDRAQVGVRHLGRQAGVHGSHRPSLGLVAVTRAPGLAADLARSGAVVVLTARDEVPGDVVARAVADTGAADVLVLVPAGVVVGDPPPGCEVRTGLIEVVTAAAAATRAVAEERAAALVADRPRGPAAAPPVDPGVRRAVEACLARTRATEVDVGAAGHAGVVDAVTDLLDPAAGQPFELLTVLTRAGTPAWVEPAVRAAAERVDAGLEVVVLHGGAAGADVELAVEGGW
ncbi:DAK2 domain-containing protein, partial [Actinotalea sp. AC32]|nr:DAK2 domain-containing protein [Actinotalea sp. AC32]